MPNTLATERLYILKPISELPSMLDLVDTTLNKQHKIDRLIDEGIPGTEAVGVCRRFQCRHLYK